MHFLTVFNKVLVPSLVYAMSCIKYLLIFIFYLHENQFHLFEIMLLTKLLSTVKGTLRAKYFKIFLMWTISKVFIESVTILLLFYVLFFSCEAWDLSLPYHGLNLHPLHWKAKS